MATDLRQIIFITIDIIWPSSFYTYKKIAYNRYRNLRCQTNVLEKQFLSDIIYNVKYYMNLFGH